MDNVKTTGLIVIIIVVLLIGIFGLNYFGYVNYAFFAPRVENVQQKIFDQSPMRVQGDERQFQNLELQYKQSSNPAVKDEIASMIVHQFADFQNHLTPSRQEFYNRCLLISNPKN